MKIGNSCRGCSFAVSWPESDQHGCRMGVLEEFKSQSSVYELKDRYYQFDRVCVHKTSKEKTREQSISDHFLPISVIIFDDSLDDTIKTLESVRALAKKVVIITEDNFPRLIELAGENCYILRNFDGSDQTLTSMKELANGYTFVLNSGQEINDEHHKLNTFVNLKMRRVAIVRGEFTVVNNILFKYLKGNKAQSFFDKVQRDYPNMCYNWSEIENTCS